MKLTVDLFDMRRLRFAVLAALLLLFPVAQFLLAYHSCCDQIPITDTLPGFDNRYSGISLNLNPAYSESTLSLLSTDRGQDVRVRRKMNANSPHIDAYRLLRQTDLLEGLNLTGNVISVAIGWQHCNCHGWTFTDGSYWVDSSEVDRILEDNGYQPITTPRPNDLAIYRSATTSEITHSGIVRYVADRLVLVESKWGGLGRFVHPHDMHCYRNDLCQFYRSPRLGHLLQGSLPEMPPSAYTLVQ